MSDSCDQNETHTNQRGTGVLSHLQAPSTIGAGILSSGGRIYAKPKGRSGKWYAFLRHELRLIASAYLSTPPRSLY
jgi:hypothetical protein